MVYSLVSLLSARRVGRVSSIIELAVDEDSLNNVFSDLCDKSTVIVEAFAKMFRGFGKKFAMEVSSYVRSPISFEVPFHMGLGGYALVYVLLSGMAFNPGGFEGSWVFSFEGFVKVFPEVAITH